MIRILVLMLCAFVVSACNSKVDLKEMATAKASQPMELNMPAKPSSSIGYDGNGVGDAEATTIPISPPHRMVTKVPSQIIKNADVRMQVEKLDVSYNKIKGIVSQFGSYFGNDNRSQSDYEITQDMLIRVPSAQFDSLLNDLVKEGIYINYKNVNAEDVTDQFVDIEARLKTKKEVELRYLALLKEAKKVSDILEVENNLRTIREEIEAQEGRLTLLKDQVSYSTIHLLAYQTLEFKVKPGTSFFSQVTESLSNGWIGLKGFILGLISVWPLFIFITIVVWGIRIWKHRKK